MKLYNTATRQVDEFKPLGEVTNIYICGPTVYDYSHLGHARTYTNSDILVRTLNWLNFKTKVVMNITDVGHLTSDADSGEDKVAKKAKAEQKTAWQIAEFYEADFWQMIKLLNILQPDLVTKATGYIKQMIDLIVRLEKKGFTYDTSDGIYFDTSKFASYGQMARLDLANLKAGARVEVNKEKKNITDFALWKFTPAGVKREMEWDSPWGKGFPGWHIECSAMSMVHLGETLDIHTGGVDHIPVHHTNEIAQSEAASGKPFVNFWFHSNILEVDGQKMSKSLKNFWRLNDVVDKGFEPLALRYLFLTAHYRTKMNFTEGSLASGAEAYRKLKSMVASWQGVKGRTQLSEEKLSKVQEYSIQFKSAIEDDLNLPQALAVVWAMVKSNIPETDKNELIADWDQVLGLNLTEPVKKKSVPKDVQTLINQRESLRKEGKYKEADKLREQIEAKGFKIEDKHV